MTLYQTDSKVQMYFDFWCKSKPAHLPSILLHLTKCTYCAELSLQHLKFHFIYCLFFFPLNRQRELEVEMFFFINIKIRNKYNS